MILIEDPPFLTLQHFPFALSPLSYLQPRKRPIIKFNPLEMVTETLPLASMPLLPPFNSQCNFRAATTPAQTNGPDELAALTRPCAKFYLNGRTLE